MKRIYISNVEGKSAICFDTGLDPRSFARTKMSQSLIEPGYIVYPDGSHKTWKALGVNEVNGLMQVWGPPFTGERLDLLLEKAYSAAQTKEAQQASLQAVVFWIRAKMLLGEQHSALNPGAAFICREEGEDPAGSVFFAPENLSNRCLLIEGEELDRYNCPDLSGTEAVAFCAGVMLYTIFAGIYPYQSKDTIFQDMREGIFLPLYLAAPGLDEKLCGLIQSALLLPVEKRKINESAANIISSILSILMGKENAVVSFSSLFSLLPPEQNAQLAKEKKRYLLKQNNSAKLKRFVTNNKFAFVGVAAGLIILLFIIGNWVKSYQQRPTTVGMFSNNVVTAYYDAFSSLDHIFMESCINGADKSDINTAIYFFAINKTRQAYETSSESFIIPAKAWRDVGRELPSVNAFGVTDLSVEYLDGSEDGNMMIYRADYLLWSPDLDYAISRSDILTLTRDKRKNWRITEILRTEN